MEVREPSARYLLTTQFKATDLGLIPRDWQVQVLGALTDPKRPISYGIVQTGPSVPDGIQCLRVLDIVNGRINPNGLMTTSRDISDAYKRTVLKAGDLVMPLRGTVGNVAAVSAELAGCNLTRGVALIAVRPTVSAKFCRQAIAAPTTVGRLQQTMNGSALQEVPIATLRGFPIALPEKRAEQDLVAATLDDTDALIESLEQLLAKKRQLKQGAMQELLTGKRRLPGFNEEWRSGNLGNLGTCHRGVGYDPARDLSDGDTDDTVRLLRSNNVQGALIQFVDLQFVSEQRVAPVQILRADDVLICMANGSRDLVGKAARFSGGDGRRYTFGAFMGCFRPDAGAADPAFAFYLFQTWQYRAQIGVLLAGSSINNLSPASIEGLEVRVPYERAEQNAIATLLSDLDTELEGIEAQLTKARHLKQGMAQALLTGRIRLV